MNKKIIIIGGVAGGASTATRLRRLDENCEIIMIDKGNYVSFANCGLPYHIGKVIQKRESLVVQTKESLEKRFNIDIRLNNEALSIDSKNNQVTIKDLSTQEEYNETYDYLILATGSTPILPKIKGINNKNVFTIWNIPDMDNIINYINENNVKTASIIGGGFIGLEMAENLHKLGIKISIIEKSNQVMNNIDFEMAQIIHKHLNEKDINLYLNENIKEIKDNYIILENDKKITSDIIISSIGVKPNSELANNTNLKTNDRGAFIVSENLKTINNNIFALGDAIEVNNLITNNKTMIPLAGPANKQGRIAANNICNISTKYNGSIGSSILKIFDLNVASTGMNEKMLNKLSYEYNKDYFINLIHSKSHAGYYPNPTPMTIKIIFNRNGKILGSQVIGKEGVDKYIDIIATTIKFKGTIYDLTELELAYAPSFSSAKAPANMIGYSSENILYKLQNIITWREIDNLDLTNNLILDVRNEDELEVGYIKDSLNIPLDSLRKSLDKLPKDKTIIIYCKAGLRGYIGTRILQQKGYKVKNLIGGYTTYDIYKYNIKNKG